MNTFKSVSLLTVLLASSVLATAAAAQTVTGPADVNRVQREERVAPDLQFSSPSVSVRSLSMTGAPAGAENISLVLRSITAEGVTAYSEAALQNVYGDRIGQSITLADLYGIANALTAQYRNDGYILTQVVIPPQTIDGGHVRFQVVEGYIDTVTVEGDLTDFERAMINDYAAYARSGGPMNVKDLEHAVLLINDLPGVSARSILSPSETKTGAADLTIKTERKPYDALVRLDNQGSRYLGQYQLTGAAYANSLLGLNDRIGVQAIFAPDYGLEKELFYGDLSYAQPVGPWGTTLDFTAAYTSTAPGHRLEEFDIDGRSRFFSAKITQPIIRTRALNWDVHALLDWRNVETESNIEATRKDRLRAFRVGFNLDFLDSLFGAAAYNNLSVEAARGLDIMDASDEGDANMSRALGDPQFSKVELEYQRLQRVMDSVNILFAAKGQLASDALLSSEEFSVGGPVYGRGYDPSEITGDDGIAGKLEVQFNNPWAVSFLDTYRVYGFVDGGRVWNDDATTSAGKVISLSSTGVGFLTTLPSETQVGFYVAVPLSREVEAMNDEDARFYFHVSQPF